MRILFVGHTLPFPISVGARARVAQFVDGLAGLGELRFVFAAAPKTSVKETAADLRARDWPAPDIVRVRAPEGLIYQGHRLAAAVTGEGPGTRNFRASGLNSRLGTIVRTWRPDVTILDALRLAAAVIDSTWTAQAGRIVVNLHSAESLAQAEAFELKTGLVRAGRRIARRTSQHDERRILAKADELWVTSKPDLEFYAALPRRAEVVLVPNCMRSFKDKPPRTRRDFPRVIFLGSFQYPPNLEGARLLVREIWPAVRERLPDARLAVIGGGLSKEDADEFRLSPGVEVLGFVPDARSELAAGDVLAVPIETGSGTRFKILDALTVGCPVVSTPKGAEGLGLKDGVEAVLAPIDRFADAIVDLLGDAGRRRRLAEAGRKFFDDHYSIERLREILRARLQSVSTTT